jgi:hypothetical protein
MLRIASTILIDVPARVYWLAAIEELLTPVVAFAVISNVAIV